MTGRAVGPPAPSLDERAGGPALFAGFDHHRVRTSGAVINVVTAGSGPPVLLLHGYPQSLAARHRVAPALAERLHRRGR